MSSPVSLFDANGIEVFRGTQSPGGGSMPVQGQYTGGGVAIADGSGGSLLWTTLVAGSELLDRTDPANPLFLAAGTYAISLTVVTDAALTAGGYAMAQMTVADLNVIPAIATSLHPEAVGGGLGLAAVAVVTDVSSPLNILVQNFDGASSRNYFIGDAAVVKLA